MIREGRNSFIDFLRGLLLIIMALDHARDFFLFGHVDPNNLDTTTPFLYFTRYITNFCAPGFVFLAGVSGYFFEKKNDKRKLREFLIVRGIIIVLLEVKVVNFLWWFDFKNRILNFQILWVIGFSMIFLGLLVFLRPRILFILSLTVLATHNLLDVFSTSGTDTPSIIWYFLHQQSEFTIDGYRWIFITYPFIPWFAVMSLGYSMGHWFENKSGTAINPRLLKAGVFSVVLFFFLRMLNGYGDPSKWQYYGDFAKTVMSYLNVSKYPPSLLFLLMTLGPVMIFLGTVRPGQSLISKVVVTFGQVPLFFYLLHVFVIHLLSALFSLVFGEHYGVVVITPETYDSGQLYSMGFSIGWVYLFWFAVIAITYPICAYFNKLKAKKIAWMQYL